MKLKISYRSQLYALKDLIILSLVYFSGIFFLYGVLDIELFKIIFMSTLFLYVSVFLLPVVFLHLNHLRKNRFKEVMIEKNNFILNDSHYSSKEIEQVNIYASYQHFKESVGVSTLPYNDYYFYIEICLKENKTITLSSLIDYKIDKIFEDNFPMVKLTKVPSSYRFLFIR